MPAFRLPQKLMLYKPSYCCNCGDKIERAEWRLWDSRRFCQLCETEYKAGDIAQRATVVIGLVLGIFGFSAIVWPEKAVQPKMENAATLQRTLKSAPVQKTDNLPPTEEKNATVQSKGVSNADLTEVPAYQERKEQNREADVSSDTAIYYCGAPTKKGTPCSRRVKTKGRCWQHADVQ